MTGGLQIIAPTSDLAPLGDGHLVPTLIIQEGEPAGWRYVEFFTANIRNPHTRRAYAERISKRGQRADRGGQAKERFSAREPA